MRTPTHKQVLIQIRLPKPVLRRNSLADVVVDGMGAPVFVVLEGPQPPGIVAWGGTKVPS